MTTDTSVDIGNAVQILKRSKADDERKGLYLSYRACYISEAEAKRWSGVNQQTLDQWRLEDPLFAEAEGPRLSEFQEVACRVAILVEYTRNYRMALARDLEVWRKSLEAPDELTPHEHQYLNKVRSTLTPEGLDRLSRMASGKASADDDLYEFIKERRRYVEVYTERSLHVPKNNGGNNIIDNVPVCGDSISGAGDTPDTGEG